MEKKHTVKEKARYAFIREKTNQMQEKSRHRYTVPGTFTVMDKTKRMEQHSSDPEESSSATDRIEGAAISAASRAERAIRYARSKKRIKNTFYRDATTTKTRFTMKRVFSTNVRVGVRVQQTNYDNDLEAENEPDAGPDPAEMRFTVKRINEEDNISASPQDQMREKAVNDYKAQIRQKRYDASTAETDIPLYKEKADRPYIKTRETARARRTFRQQIQPSSQKAPELKAQAVWEQGRRLAQGTAIRETVQKQSRRDMRLRKLKAAVESAARASTRSALAAGGGLLLLILPLLLLFGAVSALFGGSGDLEKAPVSDEVKAYAGLIQIYAAEHGIPEYAELIAAVMMQESGGRGNDPMQASECAFNTEYPKTPGGITDRSYSISVGIQALADCLTMAGVEGPEDIERISLALQGYNFGSGYISWAMHNYGGYSELNAIEFSEIMARRMGWPSYGDPQYVQHVLRYYTINTATPQD